MHAAGRGRGTALPGPSRTLRAALGVATVAATLVGGSTPALADPGKPPRTMEGAAWWYDAMRIPAAHRQTQGEGVKIALFDTAFDPSVAEFRGADIELAGVCPGRKRGPLTGEESSHGTSLASLIVGQGKGNGPGGAGIRGIAPRAEVDFYDVDSVDTVETKGYESVDCSNEGTTELMLRAARDGADIISYASASELWDEADEANLAKVQQEGAVIVNSAPSDGVGRAWPTVLPGVVAVNAADRDAQPADFNHDTQDWAVISAPGVQVGSVNWFQGRWQSTTYSGGSSQASAITAGALALVKSKYPEATANQLIQHLIHYTGGTREYGWNQKDGFGIVSVTEMLRSDPRQWPDEMPFGEDRREATEDYPMWVSSRIEDPPGTTRPNQVNEATERQPVSAAVEPRARRSAADEPARPSEDGSGWMWWLGGGLLAVAVIATAAVAAARARRPDRRGAAGPAPAVVTDPEKTEDRGGVRHGRS